MEKATKEAPSYTADQSDAHAPAPRTEETAEEPLTGLHQDQRPTESANEAAQPCDPAPAPPEELAIDVQVEAEERESRGIPMEDGDDHAQPISDANPAQRDVKQGEAVELTESGMYRLSYFASSDQ